MRYKIIKDIFTTEPITRKRRTARAYCIYKGKIVLIHIDCVDSWGVRNHYETPGGGVDKGESAKTCLIRELKEEIGAEGTIIKHLGKIGIEYRRYNRLDVADMFIFKINKFSDNCLMDYEKEVNMSLACLDLDDYIKILSNPKENNVEAMIYARDLYFLKKNYTLVKQILLESL